MHFFNFRNNVQLYDYITVPFEGESSKLRAEEIAQIIEDEAKYDEIAL